MTTGVNSNLKKRLRIVWVRESGFDNGPGFITGHKVIETPAQKTWNIIVDMLEYSFKLKEI